MLKLEETTVIDFADHCTKAGNSLEDTRKLLQNLMLKHQVIASHSLENK